MRITKKQDRMPGIILTILLFVAEIAFTVLLLYTNLLSAKYIGIVFAVLLVLLLIDHLLIRKFRKQIRFWIGIILMVIILAVLGIASFYIYKTVSALDDITGVNKEITEINVYVKQDDAAQSKALIAQPVDVLVNEAQSLAQIVEDAVVVVVHPLPHHSDGNGAGDHRQVEHAAEKAGGPLRQVYDGGRNPQREDAGDGHRHDDDDKGVFQCAQEDGVSKQGLVVGHAHKDVCTVHGGVKKAGDHAEDHGVDDEAQEEDQAGQQETIGGEGFTPDQGAAALGLLDRRFCSQENHRSFRS